MKVIHTEFKNYNRRADGSVSIKCDSLLELSSAEIAEIDSHRADVAIIILTDSQTEVEDIDIDSVLKNLPENDTFDNYKSPSQRLRTILWHLYRQKLGRKPTNEEFADFYKKEYDKLIAKYKTELDDFS